MGLKVGVSSVSGRRLVPTGLVCGLEPNACDRGGEGRLLAGLLVAVGTTSGRESSDDSASSMSVTLLGSNPIPWTRCRYVCSYLHCHYIVKEHRKQHSSKGHLFKENLLHFSIRDVYTSIVGDLPH